MIFWAQWLLSTLNMHLALSVEQDLEPLAITKITDHSLMLLAVVSRCKCIFG